MTSRARSRKALPCMCSPGRRQQRKSVLDVEAERRSLPVVVAMHGGAGRGRVTSGECRNKDAALGSTLIIRGQLDLNLTQVWDQLTHLRQALLQLSVVAQPGDVRGGLGLDLHGH